ncbi:MAG: branched-chain amino acid ABC transporter permease/ATP-binding protein [Acidimicrobiales bacterium]|nr:branched-chain amino acid ABC transporter permease/ATP-binding protein [Acidimicrobiales bacterium]
MLGTWYTQQAVFDGLINGLVYGLLAMAVVLVYRSTKVVNFAAGNMGVVGAGLLVICHVNYGFPFWIAVAIALVVGGIFGALIELIVVRRLFRAPRVVLLVATIGVAQLALLILTAYPDLVGERLPMPQFVTNEWNIADVQIEGPQLVVLVSAPMIGVALGWFLNRTRVGRTVKAAAGDPDLSRLSGINPKTLSTLVWTIAGLIATASIIMRAQLEGTSSGLVVVGPNTLLRALVAAVIARLASFSVALAAAVVLGVTESLVRFNFIAQPGSAELMLLAVALVAVAFETRREIQPDGAGAFSFAPKVRPVPARLREVWWVRNLDRLGMLALLVIAALVPFLVTQPSRHLLYATIACFAICALSLTLLTGWAGQLSLGQMALAGVGAFSGAAFSRGLIVDLSLFGRRLVYFELYGVPFVLSLVIGAVCAAAVAVVIGYGALRVRGLLLAVTTFAFAIAASSWLYRLEIFAGEFTTSAPYRRGDLLGLDLRDQRSYYFLTLGALTLVVAFLGRLRRSGVGRVTIAVRDNPASAAAYTINPRLAELRVFALSGFIAGLGGALLGGSTQQLAFGESFFVVGFSLSVVAMVVIGGMNSTSGAVIGAVWVIGLPSLWSSNDLVPLLSSSVGLLVLLLYFPGGLVSLGHRARDALYDRLESRLPPVESHRPAPSAISGTRRELPPGIDTVLCCTDVTVAFGGVKANDGVSLEVRPGEIVGLIGTNGAGKSTLMNAVGGFVPAGGTVEFLGQNMSSWSPERRARAGLGRTFQSARLFPELTVRETIQVALEARGRTGLVELLGFSPRIRRAERAKRAESAELIDFLGLGRYADVPIAELSTGTRRIVELAGLLALDARLLCLDEPTAGVAQREAERMAPLLVEVRRHLGAAMLIIEHDMPMVMAMSDRIYCLELGRVIAEGDPSSVRNDPLVVASYLGTDERTIVRSDTTITPT